MAATATPNIIETFINDLETIISEIDNIYRYNLQTNGIANNYYREKLDKLLDKIQEIKRLLEQKRNEMVNYDISTLQKKSQFGTIFVIQFLNIIGDILNTIFPDFLAVLHLLDLQKYTKYRQDLNQAINNIIPILGKIKSVEFVKFTFINNLILQINTILTTDINIFITNLQPENGVNPPGRVAAPPVAPPVAPPAAPAVAEKKLCKEKLKTISDIINKVIRELFTYQSSTGNILIGSNYYQALLNKLQTFNSIRIQKKDKLIKIIDSDTTSLSITNIQKRIKEEYLTEIKKIFLLHFSDILAILQILAPFYYNAFNKILQENTRDIKQALLDLKQINLIYSNDIDDVIRTIEQFLEKNIDTLISELKDIDGIPLPEKARVARAEARAAAPVKVAQAPVKLAQAPVKLAQAPVKLAQAPVKLAQAPVKLAQAPAKLAPAPAIAAAKLAQAAPPVKEVAVAARPPQVKAKAEHQDEYQDEEAAKLAQLPEAGEEESKEHQNQKRNKTEDNLDIKTKTKLLIELFKKLKGID